MRARAREKESAGERENYPQRFTSPVVRSCVCERKRVCVFECVRAKERAKPLSLQYETTIVHVLGVVLVGVCVRYEGLLRVCVCACTEKETHSHA